MVSHVSDKDESETPYSLVMEVVGFALYARFPDPLPYWTPTFYVASVKDIYVISHTYKKLVSSITFPSDLEAEKMGIVKPTSLRHQNSATSSLKKPPQLSMVSTPPYLKILSPF